ncbi:oxidoreductase [Rickenella mellea]|uniref:3-dehydrosphinganine reductase n=1 Tax=Rickenella mellea TaxID=50990 RepID=A0A4Y7QCN3_9AGAM|nr:oxidoreductase [Rickenella mellea]
MFLNSRKWDPRGKSCYVTGGSQGLGLALSVLLAKKGANVTIVARDVKKMEEAVKLLEEHRQEPSQVFRYHSFSLNSADGAAAAVEAERAAAGGPSDAYFLCAGNSKPLYWLENTSEDLTAGMDQAYWVQAWTAHAASKLLVREKRTGKIVFISSTLALMSFVGYTSYSPGKHALKGLAETLRSELLLYGIDIHIFFAPTMLTPGYDEEMKTKPYITKKIEEDDSALTSEQAAAILFKGVAKGHHHISGNFITSLFRASSRGSAPSPNAFADFFLDNIAWIAIPIWRKLTDRSVIAHRDEHQKYLESKGLLG